MQKLNKTVQLSAVPEDNRRARFVDRGDGRCRRRHRTGGQPAPEEQPGSRKVKVLNPAYKYFTDAQSFRKRAQPGLGTRTPAVSTNIATGGRGVQTAALAKVVSVLKSIARM